MKKIFLLLFAGILILTGCVNTDMMNTPIKKTEKLLGKYQTLDSQVINQLNTVVNNDLSFTDNQKKDYKELMKKQYQNMMYKIKQETVDGNNAKVEVEIEVYDYVNTINKANLHLEENPTEFKDEKGNFDYVKFADYKISKLKEVKNKIKYTLTFTLQKKDNNWAVDDITESIRQKIHGLYQS